MAQKSKTQRAKASAARAARKQARELESEKEQASTLVASETPDASKKTKTSLFKKSDEQKPAQAASSAPQKQKKEAKKPKKERFVFLKEVRSELKRVTWPTKQEVLRWSLVVVAALLFFGVYVAFLDNAIVTPLLVLISSLGA